MKGKIILAVGAHPDDTDFGASGTIAKWVGKGAIAYLSYLYRWQQRITRSRNDTQKTGAYSKKRAEKGGKSFGN